MNLLVTGGWYEAPKHLDEIREMGYTVYFMEKEDGVLPCNPAEIDGAVYCRVFNYHPVEQFTNLKFIQTESVGYDRVPVEYCKEHGIVMHNAGNAYANAMSEYIIGHLLSWYQNMSQELENQANHGWAKNHRKRELAGKTVCTIGTGNIARQTAKKLVGFDCKVIGVTHTVREIENFDEVVGYDELHRALAEADVLVMAAPQTGKAVVGEAELAVMKHDAVLVNVSRGTELDQAALIKALKAGTLQAAILDVMNEEPLPADDELWTLDNVILTPHTSYIGDGNAERLWQVIKTNLEKELL